MLWHSTTCIFASASSVWTAATPTASFAIIWLQLVRRFNLMAIWPNAKPTNTNALQLYLHMATCSDLAKQFIKRAGRHQCQSPRPHSLWL
ncbi:hypothetical protein ACLKA7_014951 [Drosophila subpalustris]